MSIKAGILLSRKFRGREKIGPSLANGIKVVGDEAIKLYAPKYTRPFSDVLIFYGFDGSRNSEIYKAYKDYQRESKRCVYVDLGYFRNRATLGRYGDYHRFSVDGRHPTAYFQRVKHDEKRLRVLGVQLRARKERGSYILLCGMSEKCALFEGFDFLQWEKEAVKQIRAVTDRPIHFRGKPNKYNKYPRLDGTVPAPPILGINQALTGAWATVSHHSNAGIDGLCMGVPAFAAEGVCVPVGSTDLSKIEQPVLPSQDELHQWLCDVSYCQFKRSEMDDGTYWRHLKDEGLVP